MVRAAGVARLGMADLGIAGEFAASVGNAALILDVDTDRLVTHAEVVRVIR